MVDERSLICDSSELLEGGDGLRFEVFSRTGGDEGKSAFIVRFSGKVHGYLNRCAHVPVELDWQPGRFFDFDSRFLICATHGALYEPASGRCVAGPCRGGRLEALAVIECTGKVYLADPNYAVRSGCPSQSGGQ